MLKKKVIKAILVKKAHGIGMDFEQAPDKTFIYNGKAIDIKL